jgi:hypothetical protein
MRAGLGPRDYGHDTPGGAKQDQTPTRAPVSVREPLPLQDRDGGAVHDPSAALARDDQGYPELRITAMWCTT